MAVYSAKRYMALLALLVALFVLQFSLWFGNGGVREGMLVQQKVDQLEQQNSLLRERNRIKAADVIDLKRSTGEVEEIARKELGFIKEGEVFYQMIGEKRSTAQPAGQK